MKNKKKTVAAWLFMIAANSLFTFTLWLLNEYDQIRLEQFLYQFKTSNAGSESKLVLSGVLCTVGFGIMLCLIDLALYYMLSGKFANMLKNSRRYINFCSGKVCNFFRERALHLSLALLVCSMLFFVSELHVVAYLTTSVTESDFIEENYVAPENVTLTFPEQKRNLIYIFLESMENSYADVESGGIFEDNYIKELTQLAQENVSFSNSKKLGGALSFTGTTWTAGAMVSQTSGLPVKIPLTASNYGGENSYMPGIISIGQILEAAGYNQVLLLGSDAEFAYRDSYFTEHGNYEIVDIKTLKAQGRLPENYREWWGYEDSKLFEFAKEELTRLANLGEPFNFTMLTADTHFPDGYVCPNCSDEYEEQYANVIACSSKSVYEFVTWIKEQPFYENTTIVISGDHLTMDPQFMESAPDNYVRTNYNCFINAPIEAINEKNRTFGSFDMFPTTLAALGVEIEGDRLALGTNLFSATKTLAEQYGYEELDLQLQLKSSLYNRKILGLED